MILSIIIIAHYSDFVTPLYAKYFAFILRCSVQKKNLAFCMRVIADTLESVDAFSIPVTEDDLIEWLIEVDALMEKDGELVPTPAAEKHQIYLDIPSRWYNGNLRLISKAFATCFTLMVNGTALTKEQTRGWTIKSAAPYGIVKIVADRELTIYSSDEEAVAAAVTAGMSVIPESELPENFQKPRLGWVDNPINRLKIKHHNLTQN